MRFKHTDYHVHTIWSADVAEFGPTFEEYIQIAELNQINICFLEHFELYYIESDKTYPFYDGKIEKYLEELDQLKEVYDFILSGLEVEYYMDREIPLKEFMDDYGKDLDFIAGTLHEWVFKFPITTRTQLLKLLKKKSIKDIVNEYFAISERMITSRIFNNICHIDTIFRYINSNDINPPEDCNISEDRVLDLGRLCIKNNIKVEYNLSGLKFPIRRTFPSLNVMTQLKKEGAEFFVGSDSHSLTYFKNKISNVKEAYSYLNSI